MVVGMMEVMMRWGWEDCEVGMRMMMEMVVVFLPFLGSGRLHAFRTLQACLISGQCQP